MRLLYVLISLFLAGGVHAQSFEILVFSKTSGFRHGSISDGIALIDRLGADNDFSADYSEDASDINEANLAQYQAVVFLSTTGNFLNSGQEAAFERYIRAGGGWVGVHAAADGEYDWAWYNGLLGAHFSNHPSQQTATVQVEDNGHPSTAHLSETWERRDEWYNYQTNPRPSVNVLLTLDESTYDGGTMGADHPIAWYHDYDGGRAFYTGLGHTSASYTEPAFEQHLLGGILYAAGSTPVEPTRRNQTLVPAGSVWSFWDRGEDLGIVWRIPDFDDSNWPDGPAKLGFGDGDHVTPVDIGPGGDRHRTTYFRHRFQLADEPVVSDMTVRVLRDDGAVVYLNGIEIGRSNMGDGVIDYDTLADDSVGGDDENAFFSIDASAFADALTDGENVLAVEIHQSGSGSSDLGFDLSLEVTSIIPPVLDIARIASGEIELSWRDIYTTAYGAVIEQSASLTGGWEPVAEMPTVADGIATQRFPSPVGGKQFFRLRFGKGN